MQVLLIYAKHSHLKELSRERRSASYSRDDVTPPLGLLHLGGATEAAGIKTRILDDSLTTDEEILQEIKASKYVGISSLTPNVPRALELVKMAREAGRTVILGGAQATSEPDYFLERGADIVVLGEGEITLPELIRTLEQDGDLNQVKGIGYLDNGNPTYTAPRPLIKDLDGMPGPAWHLIDPEQYFQSMGFRVFVTMATRGCPYNCIFCNKHMSTRKYRKRDPALVAEEVERFMAEHHTERVYFVDDLFTCDRKWVFAFCREVMRRNLRFTWECESRINHVTLDLLMAMRKAGCIKIHFGVESGSDRILTKIKKNITREQILETAKLARLSGIWYKFFLLIGFPWETEEDLEATRRMVFDAAPDNLAISLLLPMPGSEIWDMMQDRLYPEARNYEGLHYFHRKPSYDHDNLTHDQLVAFRDKLLEDYAEFYWSKGRRTARMWEKVMFGFRHPIYVLEKGRILLRNMGSRVYVTS